jgi:hypothetical protein
MPENWLKNAVLKFNFDDSVSTVWPRNIAPPDASLTTRLYFNHWDKIIEDRISNLRGYFGGGNSLFRSQYLDEVGGVNTAIHWGEDLTGLNVSPKQDIKLFITAIQSSTIRCNRCPGSQESNLLVQRHFLLQDLVSWVCPSSTFCTNNLP